MAKEEKAKNTTSPEPEVVNEAEDKAQLDEEKVEKENQDDAVSDSKTGKQQEEVEKEEEKDSKTELEKLHEELSASKDKYLRLYSEFENFRRRTAREKMDFMQTANETLIKELLAILDDYERAESTFNKEEKKDDPVLEGIEIVMNKFRKILEKQGLKAMEDAKGQAFDTEIHEAVTQFPAPSDDLKGKVIDQLEKGYYLHEKVIRYAKVVVGT